MHFNVAFIQGFTFPERSYNPVFTTKNDAEYYLSCDFKLNTRWLSEPQKR